MPKKAKKGEKAETAEQAPQQTTSKTKKKEKVDKAEKAEKAPQETTSKSKKAEKADKTPKETASKAKKGEKAEKGEKAPQETASKSKKGGKGKTPEETPSKVKKTAKEHDQTAGKKKKKGLDSESNHNHKKHARLSKVSSNHGSHLSSNPEQNLEEETEDVRSVGNPEDDQDDENKAEWDSEAVRQAKLIENGFSYCLVLVMEDSPNLSKYGEHLMKAVETGVRKNFVGISGMQISERVKRYLSMLPVPAAPTDVPAVVNPENVAVEENEATPELPVQNDASNDPGQEQEQLDVDSEGECDCEEDEETEELVQQQNDPDLGPCTCSCDPNLEDNGLGQTEVPCGDEVFQDDFYESIPGEEGELLSQKSEKSHYEQRPWSDDEYGEIPGEGYSNTQGRTPFAFYEEDPGEDQGLFHNYYDMMMCEDDCPPVSIPEPVKTKPKTIDRSRAGVTTGGDRGPPRTFVVHKPIEFDENYEQPALFAEAIKDTLMSIKEEDCSFKLLELSGVRSKDLITTVTYPVVFDIDDDTAARETPPPPPPTPSRFEKANGDELESEEVANGDNQDTQSNQTNHQQRKSSKVEVGETTPNIAETPNSNKRLARRKPERQPIGVKTKMRKRGEVLLPEYMKLKHDAPIKGPRKYILLQGFYNPHIIAELRKIGVMVDAIVLMTGRQGCSYNGGPRQIRLGSISNSTSKTSVVWEFWKRFAEMFQSPPYDQRHITILNYSLPRVNQVQLDTTEGLLPYVFAVFDEVATRIYELVRNEQLCCCKK